MGYKIQLNTSKFKLKKISSRPSNQKLPFILNELHSYLENKVISVVQPLETDIVSRIFSVPKPDKSIRIILDLSRLNMFINKVSFKLEDRKTIMYMIEQGDFLASIDLKNAFFSISLHDSSKRLTCFEINGIRYCYNVLPFGLTSSPRIFYKILKPVISYLRTSGIKITAYLDDIFICGKSFELVREHLKTTIDLLESLGFLINYKKSNLIPSHKLLHLGYLWDSLKITIILPEEKLAKIRLLSKKLLNEKLISLRKLSSLLGLMVSSSNAFKFAPIHYRKFQFDFLKALKYSEQWDDQWSLSSEAKQDLLWWSNANVDSSDSVCMNEIDFDITLFTDSSLKGWGAYLSNGLFFSGFWSPEESLMHINFLELKAVYLAIRKFLPSLKNKNVHIRSDNSTAIFYLNRLGGTKSKSLCLLALQIWDLLIKNSINIFASHIAGWEKNVADFFSRYSHNHEYLLKLDTFNHIKSILPFMLNIDLFASNKNKKLDKYVSLFDDPCAFKIDAFSFTWLDNVYCFPPIPLISKALLKVFRDDVESCFFVTPAWNTLPLIPLLEKSLIFNPILIPYTHVLGCMPTRHPFYLMGWPISNSCARKKEFQVKLQMLSSKVLAQVPSIHIEGSGRDLVLGLLRKKIPVIYLPE